MGLKNKQTNAHLRKNIVLVREKKNTSTYATLHMQLLWKLWQLYSIHIDHLSRTKMNKTCRLSKKYLVPESD